MNVLLVQPTFDPGNPVPWPPVGLGYLATALRGAGHTVRIVDYARDFEGRDEGFQRLIGDFGPGLVGFTAFTMSVPQVRALSQRVRTLCPDIPIVLGGPHVSSLPERVFRDIPDANFGIRGEGERPLRELVGCIQSGADVAGIPGLVWRDHADLRMNPPYFTPNADEYGEPAWDLIDPLSYAPDQTIWPTPVFTSRGCPFPCTFCAAKVTSGQALRRRSMESIFAELRALKQNYGLHRFMLFDEGFGTSKKFILEFCRYVRATNFDGIFHSGTGIRLDQIDEELLDALTSINFHRLIAVGIESGSERILKLMHKQSNLQLVREKVQLMDRMGFEPTGFFILGYPGETREEMRQTVQLALELPLREASFTPFQPLPGTEATRMLQESGELPLDFDFASIHSGSITYTPRGISAEELQAIRRKAILRFYLRPHILWRMLRTKGMLPYLCRQFVNIFMRNQARTKANHTRDDGTG